MTNSFNEIINNPIAFMKLKQFLFTLNPNINWSTECCDLCKYDVHKIVKKIARHAWNDKDLALSQYNHDDDLIMKYSIIFNSNTYIGKIGVMDMSSERVDETVINELSARIDMIVKILKIYGHEYMLSNDVVALNRCKYIIPTCSLTYSGNILNRIDTSKILLPTDDYYAVITSDVEIILNNFIHNIINYIDTDEIHDYEYNYIMIKNK